MMISCMIWTCLVAWISKTGPPKNQKLISHLSESDRCEMVLPIFFAFCKRSLSPIGKRSERTYKARERSERTYRAHTLGQQLAYNAEDEGLAWTVGSHTPSLLNFFEIKFLNFFREIVPKHFGFVFSNMFALSSRYLWHFHIVINGKLSETRRDPPGDPCTFPSAYGVFACGCFQML